MEFTMHENGYQTDFDFGTLTISGNKEDGFRPYTLMASSVAGCSGMVLKKVLEKMRVEFDDIKISVDVQRNPDVANRIEEIKLHFTIFGKDVSEKKMDRAIELTNKNCAMIQSVKSSIHIAESYEIQS